MSTSLIFTFICSLLNDAVILWVAKDIEGIGYDAICLKRLKRITRRSKINHGKREVGETWFNPIMLSPVFAWMFMELQASRYGIGCENFRLRSNFGYEVAGALHIFFPLPLRAVQMTSGIPFCFSHTIYPSLLPFGSNAVYNPRKCVSPPPPATAARHTIHIQPQTILNVLKLQGFFYYVV
jgi:hypothetical protein